MFPSQICKPINVFMFVASIRAYFVLIGNPHQFREVSPDILHIAA